MSPFGVQGRTKDGHRRCGAANPLLSNGVLFTRHEIAPLFDYRIALTHQVQGDQKAVQLAFPKIFGKKRSYWSPKDLIVTSGLTMPQWYTTPSESSFIITSAGEKREVSIW